jgi:hypothetical protein
MTIQTVPGGKPGYFLIDFDKQGRERQDDPDAPSGRLSDRVAGLLTTPAGNPITDIFLMSHGWQGDVPAAKRQYDAWTGAMAACRADLAALRRSRPGFAPLIVGLHWPSLPWGDEDPTAQPFSFAPEGPDPMDAWIDDAADRTADTPRARAALRTLFAAAIADPIPDELPTAVIDAYRTLAQEANLVADGPAGAPGSEGEGFDPELSYREAMADASDFGGLGVAGGLLMPLRQLSFWQMKTRARHVGETGAADLLRRLQTLGRDRDLRFHLMGHSFGCIVVSAAINGAGGDSPLVRPVHSLFLAQGALSLWSYCAEVPGARGLPGYFHPLIAKGKVAGPVVTTQSWYDTAVRVLYPLAAGVANQVDYAPGSLPRYGGVGVFGIQGPGVPAEDREMLAPDGDYGFRPGRVYNLDAGGYINQGGGASGAHSDIAKPAVAHAFWQAVSTGT